VGVGGRAEEAAGKGNQRRLEAVAAAARGKRLAAAPLDNTRTGEVHWGLVTLLEWLAGGERERAHELKAAAAMAGGSSGWRAEGRKGGLSRPARVRG
jgi:hypothetical protein